MGSPGSGKGTQTERIQKNFKVEALSSGGEDPVRFFAFAAANSISVLMNRRCVRLDLLRVNIAQGTEIGKLASKIIKEGGLVPDETMISLVLNELPKYSSMTWMLDGFPRTRQQAEKLDKELEKVGPLDHVINLDVPAEVILKRIEDRWVHIPSVSCA